MTAANKDLVRAFLECKNEHDYGLLYSEYLTPESTWVLMAPSLPNVFPLEGAGIAAFYREADQLFEDGGPVYEIDGMIAEGPFVAVEATLHGVLRTGQEYRNRSHLLIEVRDGRIHTVRDYLDSHMIAKLYGE